MAEGDWQEKWGAPLAAAVCENCDRRFLLPPGSESTTCPNCFHSPLSLLDGEMAHLPHIAPPELVLPFTVAPDLVDSRLQEFARGIPFAPADLAPATLRERLQPAYLPEWLVDATAQAQFQAEAGFDYEVVSHKEQFRDKQWHTVEVKERRKRWEPRVGRLQRHYANVAAPALEEEARWLQRLGSFDREAAQPFEPEALGAAMVHLPDRAPGDAWPDARLALQAAAAEECRRAAAADHIRDFRWSPTFAGENWTQLLRPVYTTYYLDDEGRRQPIAIHGQTGKVSGRRRPSMKRAQQLSIFIGVAAAVIFVVSAALSMLSLFLFPPLLAIGAAGLLVAFLVLLGALAPPAIVWFAQRRPDPAWSDPQG